MHHQRQPSLHAINIHSLFDFRPSAVCSCMSEPRPHLSPVIFHPASPRHHVSVSRPKNALKMRNVYMHACASVVIQARLSRSLGDSPAAPPNVPVAHVYKGHGNDPQGHQLRWQQDSSSQQARAVASQGVDELFTAFLASLEVTSQFAACRLLFPWTIVPGVGASLLPSPLLLSRIVLVLIGWSLVREPTAPLSAGTVKVKLGAAAGETTSAGKAASSARKPTGGPEATATESTALVAHHAEEDLRVDAAHSPAHAPAAKHVGWVEQVVAVVVGSLLPARESARSTRDTVPCLSTLTEGRSRSRRLPACP